MIVMIDNGCDDPIQELDYFLNFHNAYLRRHPAIIAVTHYDDACTRTGLIDYHRSVMKRGFNCRVMRIDSREPEEVKKAILTLLIEIMRRST